MNRSEFEAEARRRAPAEKPRCPTCREKALAKMKAAATVAVGKLSVVIASRNEGQHLVETVRQVRENESGVDEVIVVDDGSDVPEPVSTFRHARPLGSASARRAGCAVSIGDVVIVMDPHMDLETKGDLRRLAESAAATGGVVYCGCSHHFGCGLKRNGPILDARWLSAREREALQDGTNLLRTDALMGACYAIPRSVLQRIGGWPYLPGLVGWEELALALILGRCGVPIHCRLDVNLRHEFRKTPPYTCPLDRYWVNLAAAYRLAFSESMWRNEWRPRLKRLELERGGKMTPFPMDEQCLRQVETPEYTAYRDELQTAYTVEELDFLMGKFPK